MNTFLDKINAVGRTRLLPSAIVALLVLIWAFSAAKNFPDNLPSLGGGYSSIKINLEISPRFLPEVAMFAAKNSADAEKSLPQNFSALKLYSATDALIVGILYYSAEAIDGLTLRLPQEHAEEIFAEIDNLSLIIGDRFFYFSHDELAALNRNGEENFTYVSLPIFAADKSVFSTAINWRGDGRFVLQTLRDICIFPERYWGVWLGIFWLIVLRRRNEKTILPSRQTRNIAFVIGLILPLLAGLAWRVNECAYYPLSADELYAATLISAPDEPLNAVIQDRGNPPLYFFLLREWMQIFGWSEWSARMLSAILGAIGIGTLAWWLRITGGKIVAVLGAAFLAFSAVGVYYAQETRAYVLLIALISAAAAQLARCERKSTSRNFIWYALIAAALINTHYYGCLLAAVNFLYFVAKNRRPKNADADGRKKIVARFFGANVASAATLIPFVGFGAFRGSLRAGFNDWLGAPTKFIIPGILAAIAAVIFIYARKFLSARAGKVLDYAVFASVGSFLIALIISLAAKNVLHERYLFALQLPLVIAIVSALIREIPRLRSRAITAILAVIIFSVWRFNADTGTAYHVKMGGATRSDLRYVAADTAAHPLRKYDLIFGQQQGEMCNSSQLFAFYGLPQPTPHLNPQELETVYIFARALIIQKRLDPQTMAKWEMIARKNNGDQSFVLIDLRSWTFENLLYKNYRAKK